jgi:hypothetical protein
MAANDLAPDDITVDEGHAMHRWRQLTNKKELWKQLVKRL